MPRPLGIVSPSLSAIQSSNNFTPGGTTPCLPICHVLEAQLARVTPGGGPSRPFSKVNEPTNLLFNFGSHHSRA